MGIQGKENNTGETFTKKLIKFSIINKNINLQILKLQ